MSGGVTGGEDALTKDEMLNGKHLRKRQVFKHEMLSQTAIYIMSLYWYMCYEYHYDRHVILHARHVCLHAIDES